MEKNPRLHRRAERKEHEENIRRAEGRRRRRTEQRRPAPSKTVHPRHLSAHHLLDERRLQGKQKKGKAAARRHAGAQEVTERQEREKDRPRERQVNAESSFHGRLGGRAGRAAARSDARGSAPPGPEAG